MAEINKNSWRETDVTIQPGECETVYFQQTKPNMFYISNPNTCKLHVGISKMATEKNYEYGVIENSSATFGRPNGTQYLYIYNKGTLPATVKIFSIADKFDLNILESIQLNLEGVKVEATAVTDIAGFREGVKLPSGDNNIGRVDLGEDTMGSINSINTNQYNAQRYLEYLLREGHISNFTNLYDILTLLNTVSENSESSKYSIESIDSELTNVSQNSLTSKNNIVDIHAKLSSFFASQLQNMSTIDSKLFEFKTIYNELKSALETIDNSVNNLDTQAVIESGFANTFYKENEHKLEIDEIIQPNVTINAREIVAYKYFDLYVKPGTTSYIYSGENHYIYFSINNAGGLGCSRMLDGTRVMMGTVPPLESDVEGMNKYNLYDVLAKVDIAYGDYLWYMTSIDNAYIRKYQRKIYKTFDGLLWKNKRIKDCEYAGTHAIGANTTVTLAEVLSTDETPIQIFDEIKKIYSVDNTCMKVRIYYTWGDYYELTIGLGNVIENIEHTVYALQIINSTSEQHEVCIIGGTY